MTADKLWAEIEQSGLHGSWSWSDMLDLASRLVAYGILRRPELSTEDAAEGILRHIKGSALFIASKTRQETEK